MASDGLTTNVSSSFDMSSWAAAATNLTQYAPSARDLLLAGPRAGMRVASYLLAIPEAIDGSLGTRFGQRIIPEATTMGGIESATITGSGGAGAGAGMATQAGADLLADEAAGTGLASRLSVESARSFGNIFSYSTSRWALACIVMAIVLNRTHIYASPRRHLVLNWKLRVFLRIVPILLFAVQARTLVQSIQCQTSPEFSMLRWGNASKSSELMFTQDGGMLHTVSSSLLFGASDEASCIAVNMIPADDEIGASAVNLSGSLSRLWPLFQTLCFSQFVETLSCALQGRQIAAETGMTLFEHSLAFAEAEAAVSSTMGWGPFGEKRGVSTSSPVDEKMQELSIKRSMIMKRVNTPPEVLLVGFLSSMNHLTSHVLGIFNLQGRLRLLSTALWGFCFMIAITISIWSFSIDDLGNQALLRFPTVCIIGFIPHVLVLAGIITCSVIYGLALLVTAASPPPGHQQAARTFMGKLYLAHENMQANVTLSNIRISMHMDFYQALLKTGYNALTMASEAVYLNESPEVTIKHRTWLEEDRLKEMEEKGAIWLGPNFRGSNRDMPDEIGLIPLKEETSLLTPSTSGYSKERTARKGKSTTNADRVVRDGVGATERSGRWIMVVEYLVGIGSLVGSCTAAGLMRLLTMAGIERRPRWLAWFVKTPKKGKEVVKLKDAKSDTLDFWLVGEDGTLKLPDSEHVDIEAEMRRRLKAENPQYDEQTLDQNLYGWWLNGGWWGGDDSSGTFAPRPDEDDDTTSIITAASDLSDPGWESDNEDGRQTPTQSSPGFSRESTPFVDNPLSEADLARLLHPRNPEQRAEAQALAAHLTSDRVVTRAFFQKMHQEERTKVLTSTRNLPGHMQRGSGKLSREEEAEILEHLITTRRDLHSASGASAGSQSTWAAGASGMGEGGPQCVVCQSSPRSIIVWPCRCLSLCDECRVTLAMNNFDKCVCCRRDVGSFSRIFEPDCYE